MSEQELTPEQKDKKKFLDAIQLIEEMCPNEWATIGKELKQMAIPRGGPAYNELQYLYVEKATIVCIIEKLGFKI